MRLFRIHFPYKCDIFLVRIETLLNETLGVVKMAFIYFFFFLSDHRRRPFRIHLCFLTSNVVLTSLSIKWLNIILPYTILWLFYNKYVIVDTHILGVCVYVFFRSEVTNRQKSPMFISLNEDDDVLFILFKKAKNFVFIWRYLETAWTK